MPAAHLHDTPPPTWHAQRERERAEDSGRIERPEQQDMPWPAVARPVEVHHA